MNAGAPDPSVEVVSLPAAQRVDVLVDGRLFTSYVYSDTLEMLKKPVLYPIRTARGSEITRGYPIHPRPGENVDHPHHIGFWLNYGSVNGMDFWNNSDVVSEDRRREMGTIRHREILATSSGEGAGELVVAADWIGGDGVDLMHERTRFVFRADSSVRIIDRITRLTALEQQISFDDSKEGLLGLRLARALEVPPQVRETATTKGGSVTDTNIPTRTGAYRNSEGVSGYPDVWGRRARWMALTGVVDDQEVTVALLDHPGNVGHPTHWHARDYGLFAANPLGQAAFTDGEERLGFTLAPRASTTFRFRLVIFSGEASTAVIEEWFAEFRELESKSMSSD